MKKKKEEKTATDEALGMTDTAEATLHPDAPDEADAAEAIPNPDTADAAEASENPQAPDAADTAEASENPQAPDAAEKDTGALLRAFLAALSPTERDTLIAALSRLAEREREREAARAQAEEEAMLAEMDGMPVFHGIGERAEAIRALTGAVDWLAALPPRERLAAAYYIDRGMRYGEPTREDLLHAVLSDEALLRELSLRRREAVAQARSTLPPVHTRKGTGGAPATVKDKPKTLAEATSEAKKFLRFYKR